MTGTPLVSINVNIFHVSKACEGFWPNEVLDVCCCWHCAAKRLKTLNVISTLKPVITLRSLYRSRDELLICRNGTGAIFEANISHSLLYYGHKYSTTARS